MKNNLFFFGATLCLLLTSACNKGFYSPDYSSKTADHQVIAVLPVNTLLLGQPPKGLSQDDIRQIEEAESLAFQYSMARAIMRADGRKRKKELVVNIQPIATTNQLLAENDIDIRRAWTDNPTELAEMLQVDAVVSMRVEKYRYFSDLASFGISVASDIVFVLSQGTAGPFLPSPRNKDIAIDCEVIDGTDGTLLWAISFEEGADWRSPANQIIDNMTWRTAKRFPYLQKKPK